MMGAILAQHAPLIRDYPSAPPPPPAPPAPPTPPQPPQAEPITFSAVTRASLFGVIGSAISSTTLATITCADASMTIVQSETVAGLTFSYSAGVLTIAGTATGSTRVQRVVVSYIASDGSNTVRGSTSHEITLVKASEVLTIGSMAGAAGKVGRALSANLASPSANYLVGVTAHPASSVPGCEATLAWTEASPTSNGTLTLTGTPTQAGTFVLNVEYRNGAVELGSSAHSIVIAAAYESPAPAPAPAPAPSPPSPSPPPAPTPAPAPGLGGDPTLANVKVLMRFDTATGIAYDHRGNTFTNNGATLTTGAVAQGAAFTGAATTISGTVASLDGISAGLSVECMADISATAWTALTAAGGDQRFCPVASYTATDGTLLWALGFLSRLVNVNLPGTTPYRRVDAMFWTALDDAYALTAAASAGLGGITARPARFVHMAGELKPYTALSWERASWLSGVLCLSSLRGLGVAPVARSTGRLQIGGACAAFPSYVNNLYPLTTIVPFSGVVDELRIKTPGQYADLMDGDGPLAITLARRVIPWPNY